MNISEFLKKFSYLDSERKKKREITLKCITLVTGFDIKETDISINKDRILLNIPSSYKTEIFMRKKEILDCINKDLSPNSIREIR